MFYTEKYHDINVPFNKAKNFLDKCLLRIIIKNRTIFSLINFMIYTIIPIYNSDKTFKRTKITTQNKNIGYLEKGFVNDFSFGNTFFSNWRFNGRL